MSDPLETDEVSGGSGEHIVNCGWDHENKQDSLWGPHLLPQCPRNIDRFTSAANLDYVGAYTSPNLIAIIREARQSCGCLPWLLDTIRIMNDDCLRALSFANRFINTLRCIFNKTMLSWGNRDLMTKITALKWSKLMSIRTTWWKSRRTNFKQNLNTSQEHASLQLSPS